MEKGGGRLRWRRCGTTGTPETEIQENGDDGSVGDAGQEIEEMQRLRILWFLDGYYDGRRSIVTKY